eukprot:7638705-Lingulodinium_polyedra.AAC.1
MPRCVPESEYNASFCALNGAQVDARPVTKLVLQFVDASCAGRRVHLVARLVQGWRLRSARV